MNSQNIIRCAFKHWEEGAEGACIYGRINASATPRRARVSGGEAFSAFAMNGGYGADSGPSRADPRTRALRPTVPFAVATRNVRLTSIRDVAQTSQMRK